MQIETLQQFYKAMHQTIDVRKDIVKQLYNDKSSIIDKKKINLLRQVLQALKNMPKKNGKYYLQLYKDKNITIDVNYEINELKKDLFFIENSENKFLYYLENIYSDFSIQVNKIVEKLQNINFNNFITDRDGTISNYCSRYSSSVQSIYNAYFLSNFANNKTNNPIIITSAPLINIGLADISVNPENIFVYAGSKAREYLDKNGNIKQFPVKQEKQKKLDEVNDKLTELVKQPEYEMFSLIGSGLQLKFGQTTIARQDISNSIPKQGSLKFFKIIENIVAEIDPDNKYFRIEDTGLDIEILLTIGGNDQSGKLRDFDKGDGINFLNTELNLNLSKGPNLICGDTNSDVPMVATSMEKTKDTYSIFVTNNDELKQKVKNVCAKTIFVNEPDILVTALYYLSKN